MSVESYEAPTMHDIFILSLKVAEKILGSGRSFNCLVGISRGGLIPTRLLSDFLMIKDVRIVRSVFYTAPGKTLDKPELDLSGLGDVKGLNVLIVDDVADTGETLYHLKTTISEMGVSDIAIATLYVKPWRKVEIDFYAKETDKWIVFPWEIREVIEDLSKMGKDGELISQFGSRDDFKEVLNLMGRIY